MFFTSNLAQPFIVPGLAAKLHFFLVFILEPFRYVLPPCFRMRTLYSVLLGLYSVVCLFLQL